MKFSNVAIGVYETFAGYYPGYLEGKSTIDEARRILIATIGADVAVLGIIFNNMPQTAFGAYVYGVARFWPRLSGYREGHHPRDR